MPLTGARRIIEDGRTFSLIDDLGIVRGRHNFKMGGEIRRIFVDVGEGNTTTLTYSSRPELPGEPAREFRHRRFPVVQGQRWWYFGYLQDDLKWRSDLTVNAGLHYGSYSVVKEKDGRDKVWRESPAAGSARPGHHGTTRTTTISRHVSALRGRRHDSTTTR